MYGEADQLSAPIAENALSTEDGPMSSQTKETEVFMPFPGPQHEVIFLRRPQRFLADIHFSDGKREVAYCANSGSMTGFLRPGSGALIWDSADPKRARRYTLRAVAFEGVWVGTDTHLSNRIVEEALRLKLVPGLEAYDVVARERRIGEGLRVDFALTANAAECLVEVKSATIVENGVARFPDSKTPRGVKQLEALKAQALTGKRVVLLFLVQRDDAHSFVVSSTFDPAYARAFDQATEAGVEVLALSVAVSQEGFSSPKLLPYGQSRLAAVETS